jgi:hypothetical protein
MMFDVECERGSTFRVWYINDWGYFYITRFQAHRQVVREYERAMQEWKPRATETGKGKVTRP